MMLLITAVSSIPDQVDVESVALDYVRSSGTYVDNGGFEEAAVATRVGEEISVVMVEYNTRHVGMLQYIGHFSSYVTINSTSLEVMSCETVETHEVVDPLEPGNSSGSSTGSASGGGHDDPDPEPGDSDEGYRMKILYTINATMARIYKSGAQGELSEELDMLERALDLLDRGEYDEALELALEADEMVSEKMTGGGGEDPGVDPSTTPWIYGYIVVFDHEPLEDDWEKLESTFNATLIMGADDYTDSEHAYWVQVPNSTPDEISKVDGVSDVLALRGAPGDNQGDGGEAKVGELLLLPAVLCMGLAWSRRKS